MDVERLNQMHSALDVRLRGEKKKKRTNRSGKSAFLAQLNSAASETAAGDLRQLPEQDGSETLETLLDNVHQTGDALRRDPVFGPMKEYKRSVRKFLRYVLDRGFGVEETLGLRNPKTLQQKKYVLIRVIDDKLESLAAHVLRNQTEQWEILRRIDEIDGLLVDLMS